jgi:hypothetical protein
VRQLNPIPLEEVVMVGIRKQFLVFSLWWLLNGNVTVVEDSAGASLREALQFGIDFFLCTCVRAMLCAILAVFVRCCRAECGRCVV